MTRVWNLTKLLIRLFTLLLVLASYGGTAVGNWNPLRVAVATEGERDHEATETRRESTRTKRCLERRRSEIGVPELESTLERNTEIRALPLDLAQVREFALLPAVRDPFDRLIIAAARSLRCPLLSADDAIAASGLVQVIWH